jgi:hypothetical protein
MAAKRAVIRLEMELSVKQALDDLCERRGMTQISVMSRLVHWLVRQDEIVQASVMSLLSEDVVGELSHILLKRMATGAGRTGAGRTGAGRTGAGRANHPGGEAGQIRGRSAAEDATLASPPANR